MKTCKNNPCIHKEILTIFLREDGMYEMRISGFDGSVSIVLSKEDILNELNHPRLDSDIDG